MTKGFIEDGFIIDLGNANGTAEIIDELGNILEMAEAKNKQICLKLGAVDLKQSQLLSIKALINAMGSALAFVDTNSELTELSANNLGIIISKLSNEIEVTEDEETGSVEPETEEEVSEEEVFKGELITDKIDLTDEAEQIEEAENDEQKTEEENSVQSKELELEISKLPTLYLRQTLRSGSTISYDGNIVIIGDVHPGSEVIAKGDITIWGVLGGIAHAGARGNDFAKIRALKINAIQLRISGFYARRPDTLNIPFIQKTYEFTPEEARVVNKEIAVYKVNE